MTKKSKKLGVKIPKPVSSESCDSIEEKNDAVEKIIETVKDVTIDDTKAKTSEVSAERAKEPQNEGKSEENKAEIEEDSSRETVSHPELPKVSKLLDKLTFELLVLMEKQIQHKLAIESTMTEGEANLAKTRYILGHKSVSSLQLPTENSFDIDPAITLTELYDDEAYFGKPCLMLDIENFTKPDTKDEKGKKVSEKNYQNPVHWFGVLVPRNLHMAQTCFRSAVEAAVECANTQTRITEICIKIEQLRALKNSWSKV